MKFAVLGAVVVGLNRAFVSSLMETPQDTYTPVMIFVVCSPGSAVAIIAPGFAGMTGVDCPTAARAATSTSR